MPATRAIINLMTPAINNFIRLSCLLALPPLPIIPGLPIIVMPLHNVIYMLNRPRK